MPWYIWLLIVVVLGSIAAGLLRLRNSANEMPISKEKLEIMRKHNAEMEEVERLKDE